MIQKTLSFFLPILAFYSSVAANSLRVSTQQEFDLLVKTVNSGEEASAYLQPGTYLLKENLVAKSPLKMKGKGVTIMSAFTTYEVKDTVRSTEKYFVYKLQKRTTAFPLFVDNNNQPICMSESVDEITKVNTTNKLILGEYETKAGVEIKIPIAKNLNHLKRRRFKNVFGYFDCGWSRVNFSVERSDNEFFYCKTLDYTNVRKYDYDLSVYNKEIRYVIYNAEPDGRGIYFDNDYLYVPKSYHKVRYLTDLIDYENIPSIQTKSDIEFDGICFENIKNINVNSAAQNTCLISDCRFSNMLKSTLSIQKNNSAKVQMVMIDDCTFQNCAILSESIVDLLSTSSGGNCITLSNSSISRYPNTSVCYKNCSSAVYADGNVTILNNVIFNTCRDHIFISKGKVSVQGNVIYNTSAFNKAQERNLSSDFGLIYCGNVFYTSPEKVLDNKECVVDISENILSGAYAYGGDARGIFVDDGRCDVSCSNNIVCDTQLYSIDSRNATTFIGPSSVRNKICNNILQERYRLEVSDGVSDDNKALASGNCILSEGQNNVLRNITRRTEDYVIVTSNPIVSETKKKVLFEKRDYRKLKVLPYWKHVKNIIGKK